MTLINNYLVIEGCKLVLTCLACPEQYDVYFENKQIGYLRLRHGNFRAEYPDVGGTSVYFASPKGDGCFLDYERLPYLTRAVKALLKEHNRTILKNLYKEVE